MSITDNKDIFVVHYLNNKYGFEVSNKDAVTKMKDPLIKVDSVSKSLKAITAYKLVELQTMCDKLSLSIVNADTNKKRNKTELYDVLFKYF